MIGTVLSFSAGFVSGWMARSTVSSTREALVKVTAAAYSVRAHVQRAVAEQVEWVEDTLAEGRSRYEAIRRAAQHAAEESVIAKERASDEAA